MRLTFEQKLDSFARYLRHGRTREAGAPVYSAFELCAQASAFLERMTGWDASVDAAMLVEGLQKRWQAKAAATRARNAPRRREEKARKRQLRFSFE